MKKNAIIYLPLLVLVAGIIFSGTALAGSGAAGKIEIINSSSYKVEVAFQGLGCMGCYKSLCLKCGVRVLNQGEGATYGYGWGVTSTWVNVANYHSSYDNGNTWPCETIESHEDCLIKHKTIKTRARKTTTCTLVDKPGLDEFGNTKNVGLSC